MVRVIDAYTGRDVQIGDVVPLPNDGSWTLLAVDDRIVSVTAFIREDTPKGSRVFHLPLQVRWTHPKYFLNRVAFVPT